MTNDYLRANPPTWAETLQPIATPLVWLAVVLTVVVVGLLWPSRKVRPTDIVIWLICAAMLSIGLSACQPPLRESQSVVIGCLIFLWTATFLGIGVTFLRLEDQRTGLVIAKNILAVFVFACLMMVLLWPAIQNPPDGPRRRTQCKSHLKQIGLALYNYHDRWQMLPAQELGEPPQSWRVAILPYLDQAPLYNQYHHDRAWDSPDNAEFAATSLPVFQCPNQQRRRDPEGRWLTSYAALDGPNCIWRDDGPLTFEEITDGSSNTIMVVEACGKNIVWNEPRDADLVHSSLGVNLASDKPWESPGVISSCHDGGANVLLADGAVRFISSKIDPKTLEALITADGGETVGEF